MAHENDRRKKLRGEIFKEQSGICIYCGMQMITDDENSPLYATFDHLFPKSKGGKWERGNLVLCHKECNQLKADNIIYKEKKDKIKPTLLFKIAFILERQKQLL